MFFIFGSGQKQKHLRDYPNIVCPECGRYSSAELLKNYSYFHLFFIPLLQWNRRYYVRLKCCGTLYSADENEAVLLMEHDTLDFSKLSKISGGRSRYGGAFDTRCAACGRESDGAFCYCPFCGGKKQA